MPKSSGALSSYRNGMCDPFIVVIIYKCIMQEKTDGKFSSATVRQRVPPDDT